MAGERRREGETEEAWGEKETRKTKKKETVEERKEKERNKNWGKKKKEYGEGEVMK